MNDVANVNAITAAKTITQMADDLRATERHVPRNDGDLRRAHHGMIYTDHVAALAMNAQTTDTI